MASYKLLVTMNSHPNHERELFAHIRELVNKLSPLGLELTDAWYTIYGQAPEILLGFIARRGFESQLDTILTSEEWEAVLTEFKEHVTDYKQRIVRATGGFQF